MRHYSALYGKLGALRDSFLNFDDIQRITDAADLSQAVSYLASKGLVRSDVLEPKEIERQLRENFISRLINFMFYVAGPEKELFEFFLYKYDIYNLKILLALHFSKHDRDVANYVYHTTPLFKRYAFLIDRESIVDKDLLLAFNGTRIFPFLMHAYRHYKDKGDLFFLDTILEDEYYHALLEKIKSDKDRDLLDVFRYVLVVHNILWAVRLHFIYKLSKEEIYYYLVLPLPGIPTQRFMDLFSTDSLDDFKTRLEGFFPYVPGLNLGAKFDDIEDIKKRFWDALLEYLWHRSKSVLPFSLSGMVAWIFAQEMFLDKVSFILYEKYIVQEELFVAGMEV